MKNNNEPKIKCVKDVESLSLSKGYNLAKASNQSSYDPKMIDKWFSEQRKDMHKFARELVTS